MNVAYIPVRGGSKSIPLKNIKPIAGRPLVWWAANAACGCDLIDKVYVTSDNEEIRAIVSAFGLPKIEVINRSKGTATDTASTESAMLEFAQKYHFDNIALVQATSPLITAEDLQKGFKIIENKEANSVLSVVRQYRFIWKETADGFAEPDNYNFFHRPLRQDFNGFLVENGAFYITSKESLLQSKCRISGNIKTIEMLQESYIEIDEPVDWLIVEQLLKRRLSADEIPAIKLFLTDCDGTLTDGGMYYSVNGEELKKFNTRDAVGLRILSEHGIKTGIITSENTDITIRRGEKIAVDEIIVAAQDKLASIRKLCEKYNIGLQNVAYVGDDLNDLEALANVGIGFCPADACEAVYAAARHVTKACGGAGAVREATEYVLRRIKK